MSNGHESGVKSNVSKSKAKSASPAKSPPVRAREAPEAGPDGGNGSAAHALTRNEKELLFTVFEQVRAKLKSADDRLFGFYERRDIHDALRLMAPLNDEMLKQLVIALDTDGRLLDELGKADDDDKKVFASLLARIEARRNTLLSVQRVSDPAQPKFGIAGTPTATPWRFALTFSSVAEMLANAKEFVEKSGGKIAAFGILAHGDASGVIQLGSDIINWENFSSVERQFAELDTLLLPHADVVIYGCISGKGVEGTALLVRVSKALPGHRVVGFNVVNIVNPDATVVTQPGGDRFNPELLTSNAADKTTVGLTRKNLGWERFRATLKPATPESAHAKIVKNGIVLEWPELADEDRASRREAKETPEIDGVEPKGLGLPLPSSRHGVRHGSR